ncbi:unnamed protein product [Urochloa humidicola]
MSFAAVVQWWEAWQLRVLAISRMLLQWFLFFSAASRKFQIRGWFRFFIWLSYLSCDALAIYALAILYNRHKNPAASSSNASSTAINSHGLQVLWAPVLLIHLAGQDTITAYNVEDNELWTRHVMTVASQITIAVYVFYKSWSGQKRRLLEAAVILFVAGILRCSEKPWALHRASINSLVSKPPEGSFLSAVRKRREWQRKRILSIMQRLVGVLFSECLKTFSPRTSQNQVGMDYCGEGEDEQEGEIHLTLQGYIKHAAQFFAEYEEGADSTEQNHGEISNDETKQEEELEKAIPHLPTEPRKLFVDLPFPYARRLCILKSFFRLDAPYANRVLQAGLSNTFDLLYTKERVFQTDYGLFVRSVGMILNFVSLGLFYWSPKHDYDREDVIVTYILLAGTAALEALAYCRLVCLNNDFVPRSSRILSEPPNNNPLGKLWDRLLKRATEAIRRRLKIPSTSPWMMRCGRENNYYRFRNWLGRPRWSKAVAQYNLLDSFIRDARPTLLSRVASWFSCKDYLDRMRHVEYQPSSRGITDVVLAHIKRGWIEYIRDVATYKRFNSRRGQWTLGRYCRELRWSVQKPFDESVLLWHIATDLCVRQHGGNHQAPDQQGPLIARCREMSNYMIYLLFVQPEMLLAGTRRCLFTAARGELEELFVRNGKTPPLEGSVLSREILAEESGGPANSIHDACMLAKALRRLGDDKMWEVVEGVWVEMLCYSASRCRGYLHAKSLGSGGEYLSYVWMLLSYMGMESLADRFQQPEPTEEDDMVAVVSARPSTSRVYGGWHV